MKTTVLVTAISWALVMVLASGCTTETVHSASSTRSAQSDTLAGQRGNAKRNFPPANDPCGKAARKYVAASGHSAYASTHYSRFDGQGFICGSSLNRKSTEEAEAIALRHCEAGAKKWQHYHWGKCEIHASK